MGAQALVRVVGKGQPTRHSLGTMGIIALTLAGKWHSGRERSPTGDASPLKLWSEPVSGGRPDHASLVQHPKSILNLWGDDYGGGDAGSAGGGGGGLAGGGGGGGSLPKCT